mmetsp:Transcript_32119/g.67953  ORF Transcript_32119/g.67953 Transcript_32119/m.67953 type:complete len:83 (-) Transcript_32119:402-650(-)
MDQPTSDPLSSMYNDPGKIDMEKELTTSTNERPTATRQYRPSCFLEVFSEIPSRYCSMQWNTADSIHVERDSRAKIHHDTKQ